MTSRLRRNSGQARHWWQNDS